MLSNPTNRNAAPVRQRGLWARLLTDILHLSGTDAEFLHHAERPWSSATFSGSRHTIVLAFRGAEAVRQGEVFANSLPDHEFSIPGHLVADAAVVSVMHETVPVPHMTVETQMLLLEDV
ncbi:MAG: hypothetical protein P8Y58_12355 [Novosphingobium sp.]